MKYPSLFVVVVMTVSSCDADDIRPAATLAVVNAHVWTGNSTRPRAEAVAVRGDSIVAVGSDADVRPFIDRHTVVLDARGALVSPGFIDSHVHLLSGGYRLSSVQLRHATTPDEFIARIAAHADTLEPGAWITGGDWDHENWGGVLPDRSWIDSVTAENPVWINRLDGHMALANSAALRIAEVDASTPEPSGGEIGRDATGRPTGILKDNALTLVDRAVPPPGATRQDRALEAAMAFVASHGVTSVHDMAGESGELEALLRARASERMMIRVYLAYPLEDWEELARRVQREGRGDEWLRFGGLKGFVDGSLGSHTAAFLEPYSDDPSETGLLVHTPEDLATWIGEADNSGLHVMVHAIGDRAIRSLLDIYAAILRERGPRDRRFRIEHAQHIASDDLERFAELDVIASIQPYHIIDDGRWAEPVIGPARARTTYAIRSLIDSAARIALGSDWFVAPPTPLEGIYAAVTRRTLDGAHPDGWVPIQKITVEEALRGYTVDAAFASFEEDIKGTIEEGKLADLVVLDRDITTVPPETIREARVLTTIVGGKVVFSAGH